MTTRRHALYSNSTPLTRQPKRPKMTVKELDERNEKRRLARIAKR